MIRISFFFTIDHQMRSQKRITICTIAKVRKRVQCINIRNQKRSTNHVFHSFRNFPLIKRLA